VREGEAVPVHMHDRLSASTDLRPVRPDAARESKGAGRVLAGISDFAHKGLEPLEGGSVEVGVE